MNVISAEVDTVGREAQDEFFVTYRVRGGDGWQDLWIDSQEGTLQGILMHVQRALSYLHSLTRIRLHACLFCLQGEPLAPPMVTLITNSLQYYLSLAEVAREESY